MVLLALIRSRVYEGRRLYVVRVDLKTGCPSFVRAILIKRLSERGMDIALCRIVLAVLDNNMGIFVIVACLDAHSRGDTWCERRGR